MPAVILTAGLVLLGAARAAGESNAGSEFAPILFGLAALVVGAKLGGLLAERWGQPSVLGELLFGIVLANLSALIGGGSGIEFVRSDPTLRFLAEVGVLILLFDVVFGDRFARSCQSRLVGSPGRPHRRGGSVRSGLGGSLVVFATESSFDPCFYRRHFDRDQCGHYRASSEGSRCHRSS
jgi:hypothetical protein